MQYLFPKILRRERVEMLVFQMNHISSTCSKASIGPHLSQFPPIILKYLMNDVQYGVLKI